MTLKNLVITIRQFRSLHKWAGLSVFLFMIITGITGVMLGWKKNMDVLQPSTHKGNSKEVKDWVSFDRIATAADNAIDSAGAEQSTLDRLDARPDKGIVKVIYSNYWEVQVDGQTGRVLSVAKRNADWIEHLHDGSIISDTFKLIYTNYIGWGLLLMSLSGFWLWYGPRKMRALKQNPE